MKMHRNRVFRQTVSSICLCVFFALGFIERAEPAECGNRVIDSGEQCDDGNTSSSDGCSAACQIEEGWNCDNPTPVNDIPDGSFEAGTPNPYWTEASTNFGSPICSETDCGFGEGTGPADGSYWAWFGGVDAIEESSLSQSVVIPSTATELQFDLEVSACDSSADYFELLIDENREFYIDGSSSSCGNLGYITQTVDVSAYADSSSHTIKLHSESFAVNLDISNFFVDALKLLGGGSMCSRDDLSLTLKNRVINNNGGAASASDWTLSASGPSSFSGSGPVVTSQPGFIAGSYDLSQSGGPEGYTYSEWDCIGGSQVDADTVILAEGESVTCTITNDDVVGQGFQINAGHAGAWFNPATSGQGQLIDVEPENQFMFVSWFTYTDADSAYPQQQRWLTAQGNYIGNMANLDLHETLGGRFDDPQQVTTKLVGEVTVTFSDCERGQMSYIIDAEGLQGTFPLQRVIPGSGAVCEQLNAPTTQALDITAGMDGAWFDPNTSGQGFLIDSDPDPEGENFMFVAWYTYGGDTASGQRWLTAQGGFDGALAELDVHETTGGSFDDPLPPSTRKVGTMTINSIDCSTANLRYVLQDTGVEGEIDITRVIPGTQSLCEDLAEKK